MPFGMSFGGLEKAAEGMAEKAGIGSPGAEGPIDKALKAVKDIDGKISPVITDFKDKCDPTKVCKIDLPRIPVSEEEKPKCPAVDGVLTRIKVKAVHWFSPLVVVLVACLAKALATPAPDMSGVKAAMGPSTALATALRAASQSVSEAFDQASETEWYQPLINLIPILCHLGGVIVMWHGLAHLWMEEIGDDVTAIRELVDGKAKEVEGLLSSITGKFSGATKPITDILNQLENDYKPVKGIEEKIEKITGKQIPDPDENIITPARTHLDPCGGVIDAAIKTVMAKLQELMPDYLVPKPDKFKCFEMLGPMWAAETMMKVLLCHVPLFLILFVQLVAGSLAHWGNGPFSNPYQGQLDAARAAVAAPNPPPPAVRLFSSDDHGAAVLASILFVGITVVAAIAYTAAPSATSDEEQPLVAAARPRSRSRRAVLVGSLAFLGAVSTITIAVSTAPASRAASGDDPLSMDRWEVFAKEVMVSFTAIVSSLLVNVGLLVTAMWMGQMGNLIGWANKKVVGGFEAGINGELQKHVKAILDKLFNFVTKELSGEWSKFKDEALPILEDASKIPGL
eukprot:TRINITY_DN64808_c0_g1_i1.p1 TRINITY_DN64808_c0_g1~~TRINITY_DN64808_c0_g1_i1.p1  ORF type:complete len:603 (+),score=208.67 TRINITY_DN64808_c0_g1_i1:107-1810(+)